MSAPPAPPARSAPSLRDASGSYKLTLALPPTPLLGCAETFSWHDASVGSRSRCGRCSRYIPSMLPIVSFVARVSGTDRRETRRPAQTRADPRRPAQTRADPDADVASGRQESHLMSHLRSSPWRGSGGPLCSPHLGAWWPHRMRRHAQAWCYVGAGAMPVPAVSRPVVVTLIMRPRVAVGVLRMRLCGTCLSVVLAG